jgi:hypothetical protein
MGKHEGGGTTGISEVRNPVPSAIFRVLVTERRRETRHYFSAIVEIVDVSSQAEFVSVTRNLSLSGCLVKTTTGSRKVHKSESELMLQR